MSLYVYGQATAHGLQAAATGPNGSIAWQNVDVQSVPVCLYLHVQDVFYE